MAKDLKNSGRKPEKKAPKKFPLKLFALAVILLGGFVYGLYFLSTKPVPSMPNKTKSAVESSNKIRNKQQTKKKQEPTAVEDKNERPRFEFYTILPEMELVIPEEDLVDNSNNQHKSHVKPVSKDKFVKDTLLLQAGSFKKYQDADRLKAKLALVGLEANIQNVTIGKDKWHRVRIGPFKTLSDINETRERLAENNIKTIIIKYRK